MLARIMCKNLCAIMLCLIAATKGVFAEEDAIVGMSDRGLQQSNTNEDEIIPFEHKVNFLISVRIPNPLIGTCIIIIHIILLYFVSHAT